MLFFIVTHPITLDTISNIVNIYNKKKERNYFLEFKLKEKLPKIVFIRYDEKGDFLEQIQIPYPSTFIVGALQVNPEANTMILLDKHMKHNNLKAQHKVDHIIKKLPPIMEKVAGISFLAITAVIHLL